MISFLRMAVLITICAFAVVTHGERTVGCPQLGMNLAGPTDWNTELPFVDVFRMSRPWISQKKGVAWGKGPELELDEHGWVQRLQPNCWAEAPLYTIRAGHYPRGRYTILFDGEGRIEVWNAATLVSEGPKRMEIDVDPSKGGFFLRLMQTNPQNYVRNIRVIMPGFENEHLKRFLICDDVVALQTKHARNDK